MMLKKITVFLMIAAVLLPSSVFAYNGIDVSRYQESIDWPAVAADRVEFAFIKATEGTTLVDDYFIANAKGANENDILTGAYHFARFHSVAEAIEEANHFLSVIGDAPINYYVALDIEVAETDAETLTDACIVFLETIADAGYTPIIYSSESFFESNLIRDRLTDYPFWVAKFSEEAPSIPTDIWQYSDTGTISGILGPVDLNTSYLEYSGETPMPPLTQTPGSEENRNSSVASLQTFLNRTYGADLAIDGIYGPKTDAAVVKALQKELNLQFNAGLAEDGVYGPLTEQALVNIRYHAQGNLTYLVQSKLTIEGYVLGAVDGVYGMRTKQAVIAYQTANRLIPDGIVGKNTGKSLFQN